jgi:hypothetical protein
MIVNEAQARALLLYVEQLDGTTEGGTTLTQNGLAGNRGRPKSSAWFPHLRSPVGYLSPELSYFQLSFSLLYKIRTHW